METPQRWVSLKDTTMVCLIIFSESTFCLKPVFCCSQLASQSISRWSDSGPSLAPFASKQDDGSQEQSLTLQNALHGVTVASATSSSLYLESGRHWLMNMKRSDAFLQINKNRAALWASTGSCASCFTANKHTAAVKDCCCFIFTDGEVFGRTLSGFTSLLIMTKQTSALQLMCTNASGMYSWRIHL